MKSKASKDIAIARDQAMKDMKDNIIDISFDIANKALDESMTDEREELLFRNALEKIEEADYE